ncbi:MAG: hypothetical protein K9J17_05785 [Flavobacteriales bacterium]|nr:hypothetical protein [Flavobacteriales bacterium]
MSQRLFGSSLPVLGYACFLAALFLFVQGYQFNTADQAEHLPQVYQMLDSELYPHDYFVNASNSIFTIRIYYEKLVLHVAQTIGLEWGLFILNFCFVALMAYSFSCIAEAFFNDRWAMILAPLLALLVFYNFTVGGNHVMYASFISSTIAKGVSSFAMLQFLRHKRVFAGLLLGLASLFQPLVGLQVFLLLSGYELFVCRNVRNVLNLSLPYLALALTILIPAVQHQLLGEEGFDKELYYEILYRFRNYHHFLPSLFPVTHYIKFVGLLVLGLVSYVIARPKDRGLYVSFVGLAVLGMFVYWVGLELIGIHAFGKTQWFKTTVWIGAFNAIMVAGLLGQLLSGFFPFHKVRNYVLPFSVVLFTVLIVAITNSKYLPEKFQHKYVVGNRVQTDLEKMHLWIADNTAKDVTVLVSPVDDSFSCEAKRSMPIHFRAIIHEPFFMLPWYEDFKEIYGVSLDNIEGIDARENAIKRYENRNYRGTSKHIDLRLDNLETCQFSSELGPIIHQQGSLVLTEFQAL